ncbi:MULTISPECIES: hypothetical protein [unclassified Pseudoalteromonas]|uniref:hypothetical protein n=1 Tax=unclassified Pseudoalteromonas TaxID=194690 RepID=UPI001F1DE422|nr:MULTISPECIES: hypothetical protein [unclassified Pseudoalteromonas]MCF2829716.1 hypothetical protein [Pseudoalteromonas sp. OF5H-5]MCF2832600.1 hypothetical protein [Pseudoalteromonas sp. DL2-H6]MCF2927606.1 hypothetical protein [Pseudoalteromonas sp. DL2-H1]
MKIYIALAILSGAIGHAYKDSIQYYFKYFISIEDSFIIASSIFFVIFIFLMFFIFFMLIRVCSKEQQNLK